jgi:hypothetical protein
VPAEDPGDGGMVAVAIDPRLAAEPRYAIRGAEGRGRQVWLRRLATFHFVCLGWVFFRATSFGNAFEVLGRLVHGSSTPVHWWVAVTVVGMLALQHVPADAAGRAQAAWSRWPLAAQAGSLAAVLLVVDVLGPTGVAPFIYFQF